MTKRTARWASAAILGATLGLAACGNGERSDGDTATAPAPIERGTVPNWSSAQKVGVGSSYEAYLDGQFSDAASTGPVSKVWFSLNRDRVSEVMWGLIHEAQLREIRFIVVGPDGVSEPVDTAITYADVDAAGRPLSPAYVQMLTGPDDAWQLNWTVFTDPDRQTLVMEVEFVPEAEGYKVFALIDPALANTGTSDTAMTHDGVLHAVEGDSHLVVRIDEEGGFPSAHVGFVGEDDGLADIADGTIDTPRASTGEEKGNVVMLGEMPFGDRTVVTLAVGFGADFAAADGAASGSLSDGAGPLRALYTAQWTDYLTGLEHLPSLAEEATDGGALLYSSALALKVMEDKTHAGALIASLSNPWGLTAKATASWTGYKAVWPRDFFQVASAFLAMGDEETAATAFRYLPKVQVRDTTPGNKGVTGWFLQKTHVDGEIEWVAVQLDQTAMPIMLGYQLWQADVIGDEEMAQLYADMLKPAADFLVEGGRPDILWNNEFLVETPLTQQERWEEQFGYSPSTTAAVISGLVTASEMALAFGDEEGALKYLQAADAMEARIEDWMFTTTGRLGGAEDGQYYVRITQNQDPNDRALISANNGREAMAEDMIMDGGFLELVRYGVRAADDPRILSTLALYYDQGLSDDLRVTYQFGETADGEAMLGFRRYGNDGYGEDAELGTNYHELNGESTPGQRGRVWPFFTGENAHWMIARLAAGGDLTGVPSKEAIRSRMVAQLEAFANEGLMLPEQVWDGIGENPWGYEFGEGTDSATPLAWTHAEYVKLLRSLRDGQVWDRIDVVAARYADR